MRFAVFFPPFCECSSHFLTVTLKALNVYNFDEVQVLIFFFSLFMLLVLCISITYSRGHEDLHLCFLLRILFSADI